jgi:hypothetical protein
MQSADSVLAFSSFHQSSILATRSRRSAFLRLVALALLIVILSAAFRSVLSSSRALARLTQLKSHLPTLGTAFPVFLAARAMSAPAAAPPAADAAAAELPPIPQTEAEWKKKLNALEYSVLRQKDTERPGVGEFGMTYRLEPLTLCIRDQHCSCQCLHFCD